MGKGGAEWRFLQQKKQSSAHFLQSSGRNDTFVADNKQSFTGKTKDYVEHSNDRPLYDMLKSGIQYDNRYTYETGNQFLLPSISRNY